MSNRFKSILAGSTVIIATTVALTTFAAAADNAKRKNTVGIQSVLPKAPIAKNENNRPKRRPRIAQPKAPEAQPDRSRQIVVVPKPKTKDKTLFSVAPKAPPAKKPSRKVAEAKPQVDPQLTKEDEAFIAEATKKPEVKKKKAKPAKKVIKKAPTKKKKKIVKKPKRHDYGTYHYGQDDRYYEEPTYYYENDSYYETEPSYHNGYGSSSGYYSGSSYYENGYSTGYSYGGGGYQCK